jgi:hypothetical protein
MLDSKVERKLGRCHCFWPIRLQGTKTTGSELHRAGSGSEDDSSTLAGVKGGKQNGPKDTHINSITAAQTGQSIVGLLIVTGDGWLVDETTGKSKVVETSHPDSSSDGLGVGLDANTDDGSLAPPGGDELGFSKRVVSCVPPTLEAFKQVNRGGHCRGQLGPRAGYRLLQSQNRQRGRRRVSRRWNSLRRGPHSQGLGG